MPRPRPILDWLRERLKPPDVVPMKRTWGDWVKDQIGSGFKAMVIMFLHAVEWFLTRGK